MNDKWWGYLKRDGSIFVARYYGDPNVYTKNLAGNPSVVKVVEPFKSESRAAATQHVRQSTEVYRGLKRI